MVNLPNQIILNNRKYKKHKRSVSEPVLTFFVGNKITTTEQQVNNQKSRQTNVTGTHSITEKRLHTEITIFIGLESKPTFN